MPLTRPKAHQLSGQSAKSSVRVVTTSNVTLSGGAPATVDGVSLTLEDRILVTAQTDATENGIYRVTSVGSGSNGTWVRSRDANQNEEVLAGMTCIVSEGTSYADTFWKLTTDGAVTLGTTELTFEQHSSGGGGGATYTASTTAPVSPSAGDKWYDTTDDILFEYINDGTSNIWVDISSASTGDSTTGDYSITGDLTAGGNVATGNVTVTDSTITATGNITGGNIISSGSILAGGNQVATQNSLGVRNLIINGDMRIAQRGTSETGNTGNGYKTVDRFAWYQTGTLTTNHSQTTDVPTGQGFAHSWKIENTTAFSPTGTEQARLDYRFEGQYLQHLAYGTSNAKTMTLSFWVKSSVTGTAHVWLYQADSGSPSVTSVRTRADAFTINSANTWEKKTITISGDTSGQIDNDNGLGLYLIWTFGSGSDLTSGTKQDGWYSMVNATNRIDLLAGQTNFFASANQTFYLTGVQLEVGDTATEFEHRPYDMELERCKRYYERITAPNSYTRFAVGQCVASTQSKTLLHFTEKRAVPSVTFTTASLYMVGASTGGGILCTAITSEQPSYKTVGIVANVSSGLTAGHATYVAANNTTSAYIELNSEL